VIIGAVPPIALGLVGHVAASLAADQVVVESVEAPEPEVQTLPELAVTPTLPQPVSVALVPAQRVADTDVIADATPDTRTDIKPDAKPDTTRTPARTSTRTDTSVKIARLRQRHPNMSIVEIADKLGVTSRTVRRHLAAATA